MSLPAQKVAEMIHQAVEAAFSVDEYLDTVAVITSWKAINNDLGFGFMVSREGDSIAPGSLMAITQQTTKMLSHQVQHLEEMLYRTDKLAGELAERIRSLKEQINESN